MLNPEEFDNLSEEEQRRLLRLMREMGKREEGVLKNYIPTLIQCAIARSKAKIVMVPGGNRGGKSDTGALITSIAATGIIPDALQGQGDFSHLLREGQIWCSALDFSGTRDIIKQKLDILIPSELIDRYNAEEKIYYFKDGNKRSRTPKIGLKSQESGEDKYQGTSRIIIWLDEEHKKKVYDECYERTVDCKGTIYFTFSPIKGLTWSHQELYKLAKKVYFTKNTIGLKEEAGVVHTTEEIKSMQDNRELHCRVSTDPLARDNIEVFIITKYDNPYLDPDEIRQAEIKYQFDGNNYNARILGQYTRIEGNCVFPTDAVVLQQQRCPNKYKIGEIQKGKFQPLPSGRLTLYEDVKPGGHYVLGCDWCQGIANGDNMVIAIYNHLNKKQVGEWVGKVAPEFGARILIDVGNYFNKGLLVPESNGIGRAGTAKLKELKYPNLFTHYSASSDLKKGVAPKSKEIGFRMGPDTKPKIEQDMCEFLRMKKALIQSYEACEEMLSYIYHEEGNDNKTGAKPGAKDDRVIASMLALHGCKNRTPRVNFNDGDIIFPDDVDDTTGY